MTDADRYRQYLMNIVRNFNNKFASLNADLNMEVPFCLMDDGENIAVAFYDYLIWVSNRWDRSILDDEGDDVEEPTIEEEMPHIVIFILERLEELCAGTTRFLRSLKDDTSNLRRN